MSTILKIYYIFANIFIKLLIYKLIFFNMPYIKISTISLKIKKETTLIDTILSKVAYLLSIFKNIKWNNA